MGIFCVKKSLHKLSRKCHLYLHRNPKRYVREGRTANQSTLGQAPDALVKQEWGTDLLGQRIATTCAISKDVRASIKYYAGVAAAIGASPIPCSDATLLTGVQVKMTRDIMKAYGIHIGVCTVLEEILKTKVVSMLGKMAAGSLIKLIPGAGTVVGSTVNAVVASTITYAMGKGLVAAAEMIIENGWDDMVKIANAVSMSI